MPEYDAGTTAASLGVHRESREAIHETSMHIIEDIGIQINHERARTVFECNGGEIHENNVVTLPRDIIAACVEKAPAQFTLHARNAGNDVTVGGSESVRAPGYGPSNIRTVEDGRRRSTLSDYTDFVKLSQMESVINCTGYNVCEPNDTNQATKHLDMVERSLIYTDQPVMGSAYGEDRARECLDMLAIVMDDPDLRKPYTAGLINTVPPRSLDAKTLGGLMTYAENGQPVIISSFTMAGASGPATLAGSMAQANAENLLAITLAQLLNPGTPVVYGVPASNIDARYGSLSIGSPESALFVSFCGQMGRYYDIPSRGGGGLSDSKSVDFQAGFESMLLQTVTALSEIDFVLHSAGILESYSAISPEKFVLDCETLQYVDRFTRGITISPETCALDRMSAVEPAGHFLDPSNDRSEEVFYRPDIADKRSYSDWDTDSTSAVERAHERVQRQLEAYQKPHLDADIERDLTEYVEERKTAHR